MASISPADRPHDHETNAMIRIVIVDDHHAIRLGLAAAIRSEPDLEAVGSACSAPEVAPLLYRTDPDVVLMDYNLPGSDGLSLCREIKSQTPAPAVILYSAFAGDSMTVPALVAGADGLVHKGFPSLELFRAIRHVAAGGNALPSVTRERLAAAEHALDGDDIEILRMLLSRAPFGEIAQALQLTPAALRDRLTRMLARLKTPVPEHAG